MEFPRSSPPLLCPEKTSLRFQVIDWYISENDKAKRIVQQEIDWNKPADLYQIYMFGATEDGHSVCVRVDEFEPYFFVRLPESWWMDKTDKQIRSRINALCIEIQTAEITTSQGRTRSIIPKRLQDHIVYMKLIKRKDFWGFTNGKEFPFMKVRVKSLALYNTLKRYFADRIRSDIRKGASDKDTFRLYESNIDPFLRFIHEQDIAPCGWVELPKGKYELLDGSMSRAGYNVSIPAKHVKSLQINKIAPLLIASFDLECSSSHGDFPVARKDYRKLVQELIQVARAQPKAITPENISTLILDAFEKEVPLENNMVIHRVFPQRKMSRKLLSNALARVIDQVVEELQYVGRLTKSNDVMDNDSDEEDAPAKSMSNAVYEKITKDILRLLGTYVEEKEDENNKFEKAKIVWKGVLPKLEGDQIIQIGTTVHRYGSDEIVYKHIVTLNTCDEIENAEVEHFDAEEEMIDAWKQFIIRLDPDILTGYNIFGFDMKYLWERAQELQIDAELGEGLGRLTDRKTTLLEQRLSSSALGDNFLYYIDMDGVVCIDMLKVMQRDHKLDSYKLDSVSQIFLGDQKDDLKPKEIFEKFYGSSADRCVIARYCLQDCALVNRLVHKLKVLENNVGMGNVCSVPLSYLFMRGQGIKIFSLVAKECRANKFLIPVLRDFNDEMLDDEEGYEGAIVLDPQEGMYLEDPITVLDYSSLYPSSMIARNLSHDCYVNDDKYASLQSEGIEYETITYDIYEGKGDDKKVIGQKHCTFAQLPNNQKGVIPNILQSLLTQRKNTRKKIEYQRLVLDDGRVAIGLAKDLPDGTIEILNVDKADLGAGFGGHKAIIQANSVINREDAFNGFEQAVLDALQLAYKITANSLYGQIGSRMSPIYWKDIAACTTATGREMIVRAKSFVEEKYGATVIYGDSVTGYTPILMRYVPDGSIRIEVIEKIAEFYGDNKWIPCLETGKQDKEFCELKDIEAWTDDGWTKMHRVIRHELASHKKIFRINTDAGIVDVTDDHSLLKYDKTVVSPKDLKIDDSLCHASYPKDIKELYYEPSPLKDKVRIDDKKSDMIIMHATDQISAAIMQLYGEAKGYCSVLNCMDQDPMKYRITLWKKSMNVPMIKIKSMKEIPYRGYVYDITTDNHHFQAGIGKIIVHNTDSIFVKFSHKDANGNPIKGKDALPLAIKAGQKTEKEINSYYEPSGKKYLPEPESLAYEKTLFPFIIFSKKRYVGNLYEDDANKKPKQKSMGIVLKRRDNAPIVKRIYGGIIDILLNKHDLNASVEFLKNQLQELVDGKVPLEDLIITKTLRAEYKDPTKIAHKVLADRMGERDEGNKPAVNERIPFVYIHAPDAQLQGDRIEHPDYIREMSLTPDYRFYITNQLMKPICQMYALCVEDLSDYAYPPGYWIEMDEDLAGKPMYADPKKRKNRIVDLRMKCASEILFEPYLVQLGDAPKRKSAPSASKSKEEAKAKRLANITAKPITHEIVVVMKDTKTDYSGTAIYFALSEPAKELYKYTCSYTKKEAKIKLLCQIKMMECVFHELHEKDLLPKDGAIRIKVNTVFASKWRKALINADDMAEQMKRAIETQDYGAFEENATLQLFIKLINVSERFPYKIETL